LQDIGIAPEEILVVQPSQEGSRIVVGASVKRVTDLMSVGLPASEAVLPLTELKQMNLLDRVGI
jgi:hypothetical protein